MLAFLFSTLAFANAFVTQSTVAAKSTAPDRCQQVQLDTPDLLGNSKGSEKREMCFDETYTTVMTKNCQKLDCPLIKAAQAYNKVLEFRQQGTPGSWLCEALGGDTTPLLISGVSDEKQKIKADTKFKNHFCKMKDDLVTADFLLTQMGKIKPTKTK